MADDIVVLSDSDDENGKNSWKCKKASLTKNIVPQQKNQHGKRKLQQNALHLDDEEAPASKRPTFNAEGFTNTSNEQQQRANCSTPKLPLIVSVETLATPSATPPLQLLASPPRNTNTPKETARRLSLQHEDEDVVTVTPPPPSSSPTVLDASKSSKERARRVLLKTVLNENDKAWQEVRQKRLQALTASGGSGSNSPADSNSGDGVSKSPQPQILDLTHSPKNRQSPLANEMKTELTTTNPANEKRPLEKEYEELINVCRKADATADMQKLIDTKLLKYYYAVHPDFVKSRGFRKTVCNCAERIRTEPDLVYYHLKSVVDELNVRRKSKDVIITNEEASPNPGSSSNGTTAATATTTTPVLSKHTEEQIKKLNKALYVLKKRIFKLEEAEVNLDDENSTYLQVERYKKRACQIYEKICDLTGESKHARRLVKKPIQFAGTNYPIFNKTLQAYINRTREFPDFFDVLRMMEHCNKQYDWQLANFEMKRIAQDAFLKVGKILQSRRKTDLYETVSHFAGDTEDPAKSDPILLAKLNENKKKQQTAINELLETYVRAQEDPIALEALRKEQELLLKNEIKENGDSARAAGVETAATSKRKAEDSVSNLASDDDSDNEDDDDDDELQAHVEKLAKDNTIDLSDDEVDLQISNETTNAAPATTATKAVESSKDEKCENNNNFSKKDKVKTPTPPPPATTTTTTAETTKSASKAAKQLRTIAEIVISDED